MLKGIDPLLAQNCSWHWRRWGTVTSSQWSTATFQRFRWRAGSSASMVCPLTRWPPRFSACSPSTPSSTSPSSVWRSWANPRGLQPFSKSSWVLPSALEGRDLQMGSLERFDFYRRAAGAFAIVATGEPRGYGNFVISKGGL